MRRQEKCILIKRILAILIITIIGVSPILLSVEKGTLYASGLIAGDALTGVIVTAVIYGGFDLSAVGAGIIPRTENAFVGLAGFTILCGYLCYVIFSKKHEDKLGGLDLKM